MSFISARNHYFSISDIMASQERVPCNFIRSVTHLGILDPSNESRVISEGSNLELPFWLADTLQSSHIVSVQLPNIYRQVYRDILKADANVVDLFKLSKYFYEFGKLVASSQRRGVEELCETFMQSFLNRLIDVCGKAELSADPSVEDRLDCLERQLVARSKAASTLLTDWLLSTSSSIKMASLVNHHRKRKLIENSIPV